MGKKPYRLNEETRTVIVERKRKGRKSPDITSITVTVRSNKPIGHASAKDVKDLIEQVFGKTESVAHHHHNHRKIDHRK